MTRPRPQEETARQAWAAYRRLHLLVDAEIARDLERDTGLSMADYEVLDAVAAMSDGEHCIRVNGLTARMNWAHSRLSRQLGRMERRGLIARQACELDGRGDDVVLTESGQAGLRRGRPGPSRLDPPPLHRVAVRTTTGSPDRHRADHRRVGDEHA
ncbi:MarR family winged helix-turn-helix transcriptional regulator [Nonomuraea ferruginea]